MRQAGGITHIKMAIESLQKEHERHIALYDPKRVSELKNEYFLL